MAALAVGAFVASDALYTVGEVEQAIITQFGKPVGDPVTPGLKLKVPFIQSVNAIDKRVLEWDGNPSDMPTKDKLYISVDLFARWRITDPLQYFLRLRDERSAQSRLDDILGSETRNAVAKHELIEIIRTTQGPHAAARHRCLPLRTGSGHGRAGAYPEGSQAGGGGDLRAAAEKVVVFGIELLDIRFKRINYNDSVRPKIYDRMISERRQIAERFLSEGNGEAARILGNRVRDLDKIQSEAYRAVEEIRGVADACTGLEGERTHLRGCNSWHAIVGGGLMSIGKSKAKVYVESDTKVSFDDVAGVDEAKAELQETVAFLKTPKTYGRLGARIPKGVLLVGPPGTGKTLLARAVAGEAGVPFFSISGSEFVEMFVGVGAARVRDLFLQARAKAPCIIFIDELDALGRARGAFPGMGGHDEKEQTLNQLLVELDGFDPGAEGMVLLAATNRPEILDPALLRAGRFDRQVLVDRPDRAGRVQILRVHLKRVETDPAIDVDAIASLTPGFTGADLANLVNEAALLATRRRGEAVTSRDFTEAFERTVAGLEKRNRLINPHEREVVAHHEMGHALVATKLSGSDPVHKVSIIPRGIGSLGYTIQRPTEDRYLMTLEELENKMAVLLGGRAAEVLIFGKLSTGAADDLNKATDIARSIVMRYGMSAALGEMTYDREPALFMPGAYTPGSKQDYSEKTAREIDCAVRELVASASKLARHVLEAHRSILKAGAARLLKSETLSADELREIVAGVTPAPRAVDETRQADVLAIQRGENEGMFIGR
jgi:cell division protease FtsH